MIPDLATLREWWREIALLGIVALAVAWGWLGRGLWDERARAKHRDR